MQKVELGKHVKVFLKGESPWAVVERIISPTRIMAKIDNHLVSPDLHGLNHGDIAEFELREMVKNHPSWEHVTMEK